MSRNVWGIYGITTQVVNVGLSTVSGLTAAPNVIGNKFRHISGGSLLVGGFGGGSSLKAGATLFADVINTGFLMPTAMNPVEVDGPAPLAFAAVGATAVVHVIRQLGTGFDGQY